MFVDRVSIKIRSGDGGSGAVAFRREKFVPRGGPSGGDGGKGGDVIFVADAKLHTLMDFRYRQEYEAQNGEKGGTKNKYGSDGEDLVIYVPSGTIILDKATGEPIADLTDDGETYVALKGGRGGRGNARFATSTRQTPHYAQPGLPGEGKEITLELKLIADVGIIGYPNVGKSTLISVISAAQPKIANYPFTTLVPNLGVVYFTEGDSFVVADIPGLVEGAHKGIGLGHSFLRHVERTRLLIHVVDLAATEERDPVRDFEIINQELKAYSLSLSKVPQLVALNKMDLPDAQNHLAAMEKLLKSKKIPYFLISAATTEGVQKLVQAVREKLQTIPLPEKIIIPETVEAAAKEEETIEIVKNLHSFTVISRKAEAFIRATDLNDAQALYRLQKIFEKIGLEKALKEAGVQGGDTVRIGEFEFEYMEW